jgi:hypothetical protein
MTQLSRHEGSLDRNPVTAVRQRLALVLAALLIGACTGSDDGSAVEEQTSPPEAPAATAGDPVAGQPADPALARARAAAQTFGGRLRDTLAEAMQSGGPVAAIHVCYSEAPAIASAVMEEQGVRLGRMSVPARNRNPDQDARGWQAEVIARFSRAVAEGEPAGEQVYVGREGLPADTELRFARGIATEPVCLACHGPELAPEVADAIEARYPGDRATGFSVDDLRGLLWVEVPAAAAP